MNNTGKKPNESKNTRYVQINGHKVYLTKPQQQIYDKMINYVRHMAKEEGRCGQPDYHKCFGDCAVCPYQTWGKFVSMDDDNFVEKSENGEYQHAKSAPSVESTVLDEMMFAELYRIAGLRERNGERILRLYLEEGLSCYKIANRIGMRQTTVNDELNRLLIYIRENRDELLGL